MNRRICSLILMPWMLLTQSVAFGHSHGGNLPAGHDLRAHIHLNKSSIDDSHGHIHHHEADKHSHHKSSENQGFPQFTSSSDHDSSAIYLNSIDVISGTRSALKTEIKVLFQWDIIGCNSSFEFPQLTETERSVFDCAPPDSGSPLFVRHHAYLI